MHRDSTGASTSRRPPARRSSRRPAATSASPAPPGARGSRSASARATATTPPTCTCPRSRCAPGREWLRASASAPSEQPAPDRRPPLTSTSESATPEPTTATTTRSPSCPRHRPRPPRTHPRPHPPGHQNPHGPHRHQNPHGPHRLPPRRHSRRLHSRARPPRAPRFGSGGRLRSPGCHGRRPPQVATARPRRAAQTLRRTPGTEPRPSPRRPPPPRPECQGRPTRFRLRPQTHLKRPAMERRRRTPVVRTSPGCSPPAASSWQPRSSAFTRTQVVSDRSREPAWPGHFARSPAGGEGKARSRSTSRVWRTRAIPCRSRRRAPACTWRTRPEPTPAAVASARVESRGCRTT